MTAVENGTAATANQPANDRHIADEEAQVTMRQLAERRQACRQTRPGAEGHQQSFSKVMEVNNDSLCNEPWIPA